MGRTMNRPAAYTKFQPESSHPVSDCLPRSRKANKTLVPNIRYRLLAGGIALLCLGILALAFSIKPDPAGLGSHQQLSLPACGFYQKTGYPCPTCGMTTAFALAVRGRFLQAWLIQPAGTLASLACFLLALLAGYITCTGRRLHHITAKLNWYYILLSAAGIVLASWLWKCYSVWLVNR